MVEAIDRMVQAVHAVMNGGLHSVWLYGSAVLDDFQLGWSDIDWLVLTKAPITEKQARELLTLRQAMLEKEPGNPYYRAFEGMIACRDEYAEHSFRRLIYWGTSGQRISDHDEQDTFSRFELARYGRAVYGPADRSIFPLPGQEELLAAVQAHYEAIRRYALQTDDRLYSCGWLLDIARCLYTLRCHEIIAKTRAGEWALEEHLFPDEAPLRKTLEIRRHPLEYKDREDVKQWLRELGPVVQRYADVLGDSLGRLIKK